mmetsp:Transcript_72570/g.198967  ORF Transcript_72570/g.198967 Transcript_72570/m.198967 type:complete len:253 (-) Transcript_72570:1002-1760(-)
MERLAHVDTLAAKERLQRSFGFGAPFPVDSTLQLAAAQPPLQGAYRLRIKDAVLVGVAGELLQSRGRLGVPKRRIRWHVIAMDGATVVALVPQIRLQRNLRHRAEVAIHIEDEGQWCRIHRERQHLQATRRADLWMHECVLQRHSVLFERYVLQLPAAPASSVVPEAEPLIPEQHRTAALCVEHRRAVVLARPVVGAVRLQKVVQAQAAEFQVRPLLRRDACVCRQRLSELRERALKAAVWIFLGGTSDVHL